MPAATRGDGRLVCVVGLFRVDSAHGLYDGCMMAVVRLSEVWSGAVRNCLKTGWDC